MLYQDAVLKEDLRAYRAGVLSEALLIDRMGNLTVEYAPFDYVESEAQIAIVGLTPGRLQAANALEAMAAQLRAGVPLGEALAHAKRTASFSGPMRTNLLGLLDAIGAPQLYGHRDASAFFEHGAKVHFTSTLRYPVYVGNRNYSGSPAPLKHPLLRGMIESNLATEACHIREALWIPLGGAATAALLHLATLGKLDRTRILAGLPHPSGANSERIAYFLGRKNRAALSSKTNPDLLDASRKQLLSQIASLSHAVRRRPEAVPSS